MRLPEIEDARRFLRRCNSGGESLNDADRRKIKELSRWSLGEDLGHSSLLTEDEVRNLSVPRGTLTPEERDLVQGHIRSTIGMLEKLPLPDHLRRIPEIAGAHHERIDGKGYPRGLSGQDLCLQSRILALADVFEALTACDRPYRQAMTLSESLSILAQMSRKGHIDPDLFALFVREGLYQENGRRFLMPELVDAVDGEALLAS